MPKSNFGVSPGAAVSEKDILNSMLGTYQRMPRVIDTRKTGAELDREVAGRIETLLQGVGNRGGFARGVADLMQSYDLPMPAPAGPGNEYTEDQYFQLRQQYPAYNQIMSPDEQSVARQAQAMRIEALQKSLRARPDMPDTYEGVDALINQGVALNAENVRRNMVLSYLQPYLESMGLYVSPENSMAPPSPNLMRGILGLRQRNQ